jgi:hypothetical protein
VTDLIIVPVAVVLGLIPAFLARRKGRSFWWWWLGGFVAWLPSLVLVLVLPRPEEPYHFRAPLALLIFALCLLSIFGSLAVASQIF